MVSQEPLVHWCCYCYIQTQVEVTTTNWWEELEMQKQGYTCKSVDLKCWSYRFLSYWAPPEQERRSLFSNSSWGLSYLESTSCPSTLLCFVSTLDKKIHFTLEFLCEARLLILSWLGDEYLIHSVIDFLSLEVWVKPSVDDTDDSGSSTFNRLSPQLLVGLFHSQVYQSKESLFLFRPKVKNKQRASPEAVDFTALIWIILESQLSGKQFTVNALTQDVLRCVNLSAMRVEPACVRPW